MALADTERRAKERVGTILRGKYRLDRLLGVGGMASVYAATHRNNKNRVAIKVLHAEHSLATDVRARFLREGYVANTVGHPGAVRVLDDEVTEDGAVFLVMDLLDGESLGTRWERSGPKLPADDVVAIAIEVCDVLAAAHAKGIVHRDIKPENVFVTVRSEVKVLDFGIARLREGDGSQSSTQTGQMVGTPAFMAPEQALARSEEIGPHTDVWAVGATIFSLLTGRFAHEARTSQEMMVLAATEPVAPLLAVVPDAPPLLAPVVDKALAFRRAARWPDASAMMRELREVLRVMRPQGHRVPPAPSVSEQIALEDTDVHARGAISAATKAGLASERRRSDVSPLAMTASADEALAPTIASMPPAERVSASTGPTTTMGVTNDRAIAAVRRRVRMRMAALAGAAAGVVACVVAAIALRGSSAPQAAVTSASAGAPTNATAGALPSIPAPPPVSAAVEPAVVAGPSTAAAQPAPPPPATRRAPAAGAQAPPKPDPSATAPAPTRPRDQPSPLERQ